MTIKSEITSLSTALNSVQAISNNGIGNNTATNIQAYKEAIAGLSAKQQELVLSQTNLDKATIDTILSNEKATVSYQSLTAKEIENLVTDKVLTEEDGQKLTQFANGTLVLEHHTVATNDLTQANIKNIASERGLSDGAKDATTALLEQKAATQGSTNSLGGAKLAGKSLFSSALGWIGIITTLATIGMGIWDAYQKQQEEIYQATIDKTEEAQEHITSVESAWNSYLELDSTSTEDEQTSAIKAVNEQLDIKADKYSKAADAANSYADAVTKASKSDYQDAYSKANAAAVADKDKIAGQWVNDYSVNTGWSTTTDTFSADNPNSELGLEDTVYNVVKNILGDYGVRNRYYKSDSLSPSQTYVDSEINLGASLNTSDIEEVLSYYTKLQKAQKEIEDKAAKLGENGDALLQSELYKGIKSTVDKNKEVIEQYEKDQTNSIFNKAISEDGLPSTIAQYNKLEKAMLKGANGSEILEKAIKDKLSKSFPKLAEDVEKSSQSLSLFTIADEDVTKNIDSAKESFDSIVKTYQSLSGVVSDYNKNGSLTLDNIDTLLSVGDDYIDTLFNENGQLEINKDSYISLAKAKLEDIKYTQLESAISDINCMTKDTQAKSTDTATSSTKDLTEATLELAMAEALSRGASKDAIAERVKQYAEYATIIDSAENNLGSMLDTTQSSTNSTSKNTTALDKQKEALENQKSASEDSKDALDKQKQALEDESSAIQNGIDNINSLIDITSEYIQKNKELEKDALESQKDKLDEIIDARQKLIDKEKEESELNKELADKQNTVAKNKLTEAITSLDKSSEGKKTNKSAKDTLNESQSDLQSYLTDHEYDVRSDALDKVKSDNDEYYDKQIKVIDDYLGNEVQIYRDACNMIDNDNGSLYGKLKSYVLTYTKTSESEFNHMWSSAQSAIDKYRGKNQSLLGLLDSMQQRIYIINDEVQVYDDKINALSSSIDGVSKHIDNVSSSINDTTDSVNNNAKALGNYQSKYESLMSYLNQNKLHGYSLTFDGKSFTTVATDKNNASKELQLQVQQYLAKQGKTGRYDVSYALKNMKAYSTGTKSASGGLSVVHDSDSQISNYELIPREDGNGYYTLLPEGNPVFSHKMTDTLFDFASNPDNFLKQVTQNNDLGNSQVVSNLSNNVSISMPITIQGDATQSTVNALHKESQSICDMAQKQFMQKILGNKNLI